MKNRYLDKTGFGTLVNMLVKGGGSYAGSRRFRKKGVAKGGGRGRRSRATGQYRKLEKRIKKVSRLQEANQGTLTYRHLAYGIKTVPANGGLTEWYAINTISYLETVLAQMRYYDPSNPSALVVADFSTGVYSKEALITLSKLKLTLRANYEVPFEYAVYWCAVKNDTNQNPDQLMDAAAIDQSNASTGNIRQLYPSDFQLVKDLYNVKLVKKGICHPGREVVCTHTDSTSFMYDPSITDTHGSTYQRHNKAGGYLVRCFGLIAHDTTLAQIGHADSKFDVRLQQVTTVKYPAGADIEFIYQVDDGSAFTNAAQVCNPVEAMNQVPASS